MPKITITYHFDDEDEARAHWTSATRSASAVQHATSAVQHATSAVQNEDDAVATGPNVGEEVRTTDEDPGVDADGMPYDPEIHAHPPAQTSSGNWRSKRGKSAEAEAARAAFRAAGGNVQPPAVPVAAAPVMPTMPTIAPAPEPVSYEELARICADLMTRNVITVDDVLRMYREAGVEDASILVTNETARARVRDLLVAADR